MIVAYVDDCEQERNYALPLFLSGFHKLEIPVHRFDFYESAEHFLSHWVPGDYDLIILDILMDQMTGVELAHKIREKSKDVRIVFCSSSNEYANESYDVGASYYIQKPVTEENILKMIARLDIEDFELRRFITLPDGQALTLRNMIYSSYSNHLIEIHTKKGNNIKTWLSQTAFSELLKPYDFFISPNNGILLNLYEVTSMENDLFVMSDGSHLPISRRKKNDIRQQYQDFLLHSLREELGS